MNLFESLFSPIFAYFLIKLSEKKPLKTLLDFAKMKNLFCSIFLIFALCSCIKNTERHGYLFELSDYQILQEGITSKERVIKIMGSPTIISTLTPDESWIYYSEDVESILFFLPDVTDRKILSLKFDETQTLRKIENFDLRDEDKNLKFFPDYTQVGSNKIGFFKSLFSNVGQIKAQ